MKTTAFFASLAIAGTLTAADFRMDISGNNGVTMSPKSASEGVTVKQASWLKDKKDTRLCASVKVTNEWKEHSFTFMPKKSGKFTLNLMSASKKDQVSCDNIRIKGANILNGDFEKMHPKRPQNWRQVGAEAKVVTDGTAQSGKNFVTVNHDNRWIQTINCKEGEAVTVTFCVKEASK